MNKEEDSIFWDDNTEDQEMILVSDYDLDLNMCNSYSKLTVKRALNGRVIIYATTQREN